MRYLKFVVLMIVLIVFSGCENEKPRWVFGENGSSNSQESDDINVQDSEQTADNETDDDVYEENETRRSDVRCGDEFGGYYEEVYFDDKWELTEKCLHPEFNVSMISDMNTSDNDLLPIFIKEMNNKLFVYTLEKDGDGYRPLMITTDGTVDGTGFFCSNFKKTYRFSPSSYSLINSMTDINGKIYYMGLDDINGSFIFYSIDPQTCESTNLTTVVDTLEPVKFSEELEDYFLHYNFSDFLVVFSQSDKKAYFINVKTLKILNIVENISSFNDNFQIGERLFFQTENADGGLDLNVFNSKAFSFKTILSSSEGFKIEHMKFITGIDNILISVSTLENGYALWKTDGTKAGTVLIEEDDEKIGELSCGKEIDGIFYYIDRLNGKIFKLRNDFSSVEKIAETDKSILDEEMSVANGKVYLSLNKTSSFEDTKYYVNSYKLNDGQLVSENYAGVSRPLLLINGESVSFLSSEEDTSVAIYEEKDGVFVKTGILIDTEKNITSYNNVRHHFNFHAEKDGVMVFGISETFSYFHGGISDYLLSNEYFFKTDGTFSGTQMMDYRWEEGWSLCDYMVDFFNDSLIVAQKDEKGDRYLMKYSDSGDRETLMRLKTGGTKDTDIELSTVKGSYVYYSAISHSYESENEGSLYLYDGTELLKTELYDEISYEDSLDDLSFIDEFRVVGDGVFAVIGKDIVYIKGQDTETFSYDSKGLEEYLINIQYSNDSEMYFSLDYSIIENSVTATRNILYKADGAGIKEVERINSLFLDESEMFSYFNVLSKVGDVLVLAAERSEYKPVSALCFLSDDGSISWGPDNLRKIASDVFRSEDGKRILFSGQTVDEGWEIWTSDGTAAGTKILVDATPGSDSSDYRWMYEKNGEIFFIAAEKLWKTSGQDVEFFMKMDEISEYKGRFLTFNDENYFLGVKHIYTSAVDFDSELKFIRINENGTTYELWSDKVTDVKIEVKNLEFFEGLMLFELSDMNDPSKYQEILAADGRTNGFKVMSQTIENFPYNNSELTFSSDYIFFSGITPEHGNEPRKLTITYK